MIKIRRKEVAADSSLMVDDDMTPPSYFDLNFPGGRKTEEQFMSWVSVTLLLVMILFFRWSASAFINPMGEQRRSASTYTHMTILLYCWVLSATALTVIPHFSTHYNEIIAAALFFPMMFATVAALVVGRLLVRLTYYAYGGCQKNKHRLLDKTPQRPNKTSVMRSFHRPFRKLLRTSAVCSAAICFVYAHCWSRDLSAFKVGAEDGAGAVCRAVFSPLTYGGLVLHLGRGADESCIWCLWASVVVALLSSFLLDEFSGKHFRTTISTPPNVQLSVRHERTSSTGVSGYIEYESVDGTDGGTSDTSSFSADEDASDRELPGDVATERPEETLPMVSWYSILMFHTVFDILIELKVFLGRFDARTLMQPAVKHTATNSSSEQHSGSSRTFDPTDYPSGSVFDCRPTNSDGNDGDNEELWFDFVADCGDGFDSSYHVARMLAQPNLSVYSQESASSHVLPRGNFLVVGGDLAYPHPTEESYEKRFFRTFEDAMPPPPSFRREQISVNKPALPVKGWKDCSAENASEVKQESNILNLYNGPAAYLIPGNHDWYDGLATYSRYILSRDWLGGWLMPQKRSYFALKLSYGWWLFGFDLGLTQDIDLNQFKFFVNVVANEMGPSDSCIIVTHEPSWVLDADEKRTAPDELPEKFLRELLKHHLGGRVRAKFAGDLHHYTRHVPMRSKSFTNGSVTSTPLPQLIVSGGGGAFLHGTHTYENRIRVGEDQDEYVRVKAYPDEKTSYRLSWLNMWQFRWRNWAFDMFGATVYFGIASSSFPLCGIYLEYLDSNQSQNAFYLIPWLAKTVLALIAETFASGNISLLFTIALAFTLFMVTDAKLKPSTRFLWALAHTLMHVASAIACLVFVECMVEWTVHEGIVKVAPATSKMRQQEQGIDLATSLYDEYKAHFSSFFVTSFSPPVCETGEEFTQFQQMHAHAYELVKNAASWIYYNVPLLKTTLEVFDLPGNIAQKHADMCKILCTGGVDCLLRSDTSHFQQVERGTLLAYLASVSLYFFILAIPFAGNVFGTWLALTLNVFKAQPNEGFSSLRIRHWKNFLRLHIDKNGDLEVFAIGLHRAPKRWIKDALWEGNFNENSTRKYRHSNGDVTKKSVSPTWSWDRPSKWIPEKHSKRFEPELIDYTRIKKTKLEHRRRRSSNGIISSRSASTGSF